MRMKKITPYLLTLFLLCACSGPVATPYQLPPLPTPKVAYQIIGNTKYTCMVVVDPESRADRKGLQELGDYLCKDQGYCMIWFWDDIRKADASYPVDEDKQADLVAYYKFSFNDQKGLLEVYTLGDPR